MERGLERETMGQGALLALRGAAVDRGKHALLLEAKAPQPAWRKLNDRLREAACAARLSSSVSCLTPGFYCNGLMSRSDRSWFCVG